MIKLENKNAKRKARHNRIRNKISGTALRPRLSVYKSSANIYAQLINDETGVTICQASSLEKALEASLNGKTKTEQALVIGETIAKRALENNIKSVVFDRGGYIYTGRVKSVAEGARNAGLEF